MMEIGIDLWVVLEWRSEASGDESETKSGAVLFVRKSSFWSIVSI